jgi:hypothetical protein
LRVRVHPLLSFAFLQSSLLPFTCPTSLPSAFLGVSFPFATQAYEVHFPPGFPLQASFRPQRFSRSRRLPPSHTLRACFIPLPRPGFPPQGLSPLPSRLASSASRALLSLASLSSRQVAPPVPVPLASPSGLCSEQRSVASAERFRLYVRSIPSRVFNSLGLFSGCLGDAFAPPPLMTSPRQTLAVPLTAGLQRIDEHPT